MLLRMLGFSAPELEKAAAAAKAGAASADGSDEAGQGKGWAQQSEKGRG